MDLDADRAAVFGPGGTPHTARPPSSWPQRVRSALSHARALSRPVALARLSFTRSSPHDDPVAKLVRVHRGIHPGADPAVLRRGYEIAERMHRGQMRKSGDPYITHPLAVAQILADLGMDTTTLVAALLHDTVEDTSYNLPTLRRDFGSEVAHLVDGVTKFDKVFFGAQAEAETIRKLILAAGKDVRVLIIKIADRLHNMQTLDARSPASRARIARATQEVLVPLCDRLGIQVIKRQLEDVVLRHLESDAYTRIEDFVTHRPQRLSYMQQVAGQVRTLLRQHRVDATVRPRPRHYYSIWKDTVAGGYPQPFDPARVVVVVDGPDADCYAALGAIHGRWRPLAGRFKDYIGAPKNNLYRSLHTTVIGPDERTVEVLIRTTAMHQAAEYGVAARFRYPKLAEHDPAHGELAWLNRVLQWQHDAPDAAEFMAALRNDLADDEIQVIAGGRALVLPAGATAIDVAYELGTEIGHRCRAAAVNSRVVALTAPLSDGDVVEIFAAPAGDPPRPREEWLQVVKTTTARVQLRRWFGPADEEAGTGLADRIRRGRVRLSAELRKHDRSLPQEQPLRAVSERLGFPDPDALLVALADERMAADEVAQQLIDLVDGEPGAPAVRGV